MKNILRTLFLDNPYLPEQIFAFCETLPEYQEADREYQTAQQEMIDQLGFDAFSRFEQAQSHYMAQLTHAYYLFGLGLRQALLSALERQT